MLYATLPSIPNPLNIFNPVDYVERNARNWFMDLAKLVETMLIHRPRMHADSGINAFLFNNAREAGGLILMTVLIVMFTLSLFFHKKLQNLVHAAAIAITFTALMGLWIHSSLQIMDFSDKLAQAAQFIPHPTAGGSGTSFFPVPDIGNVIGSILGFISLGFLSFLMMTVLVIYEMVISVGIFFGPLTLALLGLGPRSKKAFSIVMAALLVAMLLGPPLMMLMIELGFFMLQALGDLGTNAYITVIVVDGSMVAALLSQVVLFYVTYSYTERITGDTISKVRGSVETKPTQEQKVRLGSPQAAHAGAMQPLPVRLVQDRPPVHTRARQAVTYEIKHAAKQQLLRGATAAASAINPAAGAAVQAATKRAAARNGTRTPPNPR